MISPTQHRRLIRSTDVAAGAATPGGEYLYRPGELLVHTDDCDLVRGELAALGYRAGQGLGSTRLFVGGTAEPSVPDLLARLRARHGPRLRVSPHHVFTPARVGTNANEPIAVAAPDWQPLPADAGGIVIGVIDTGIAREDGSAHPWLGGHVAHGDADVDKSTTRRSERGGERLGHGTFVAGLILREAPTAKIRMIGALVDADDDADVAMAIRKLRGLGVQLINLSFSGHTWEGLAPAGIAGELAALDGDTVVVAAAGNNGSHRRAYPAAAAGDTRARLIAVGAVDARSAGSGVAPLVADFSNHGRWIDAYAPGVDLVGPYLGHGTSTNAVDVRDTPFTGWARWSGTSFAAAIVTGRIARAAIDKNGDVREAAVEVLDAPMIDVWDVNGRHQKPYVHSLSGQST